MSLWLTVHLDYEDLTTGDLILAISFDNLGYTEAVKEYEKAGVTVFDRVATSLYSARMLNSFGMTGAVRHISVTLPQCKRYRSVFENN